ncbi:multi-component transcriptional regulator, winged helix family [Gloeothece citriformis PCC 7424]|uniref:Multi-component transcriptional regulator, winged helix family n=1 Tax=Gloeothece citriformis (strain PCC 7424) TaxID=65393 RepID=B7K7W8_GLOC7|nr:response regulator [Gloeothece citriformis]ACK71164.1 multi-component transcriptional regulator, winged helix family [Gloeothece citriformis PCC 7424]
MKLLLVEDDQNLAEVIKEALKSQHYLVELATDGQTGLELAEMFEYDLIMLDLMLPKLDGIQFCQQRRKKGDLTPILLVTGQDDASCKVKALDAGADDYLVKPFNIQELLARVRALLRRGGLSSTPLLQWGPLNLNPSSCQVTYEGELIHLTAKEYGILELFLRNRNRIFSQSALIEHLWSFDEAPTENAVRTQIKSLRQKLKKAGASPNLIETVYGLGYRLNKNVLDQTSTDNNEETNSLKTTLSFKSVDQTIKTLWQHHREGYLKRITIIEQGLKNYSTTNDPELLKQEILTEAHILAGSLGSFGLKQASQQAKKIEHLLKVDYESGNLDEKKLSTLVKSLKHNLEKDTHQEQSDRDLKPFKLCPSYQRKNHHLLIVDNDFILVQSIVNQAKLWGLIPQVATDIAQAKEAIARSRPDVILLDMGFPDREEICLELLKDIRQLIPPIPTVITSDQNNFSVRVKVARLGAVGFLQKPLPPERIIETIVKVVQPTCFPTAKIMIVDDDPNLLKLIQFHLEPWGFSITLLEDPKLFWDILERTTPDLLILDVEMPEISGIELCQVVRNDPHWHHLPILFLSGHRESKFVSEGFQAGADDYIYKPIVDSELVTRILNRLERERQRRQLADIDSITGLASRSKSIHDISRMLRLAKRQGEHCCFVLLDVDHFQQINEQYGYPMGDEVLRRLGELLKQTFRNEDIVARWGGEEFVLGLYNLSLEGGMKRINDFLEIWSQEIFITSLEHTFQVTLSAGIAEYPSDGQTLQTLYQSAQKALYQAKTSQGDRVLTIQEFTSVYLDRYS